MPFSTEDKVIIKHYRLNKHCEVKRLLKEFPNKGWTKWRLRDLLGKIDKTRDFARIPGSSRTPTVLTNKNIEEVEELALSQEENPGTHESQRNIGRIIGISQSSVSKKGRQFLGLTAFHKTKVQDLSDTDKLQRVIRGKRWLLTVANINKTFFYGMRSFWNSTSWEIYNSAECMPQGKGRFLLKEWLWKRKHFRKMWWFLLVFPN